ncbi:MAG: hypothetical protein NTZ16_01920, partial [Verrucomicrobia bacterium]|nr:hypothetical protein [Verrucomicrobiota bacterium]
MGLNILDITSAEAFLDTVVEQFKNQRMCSPTQTAHMTITIAGEMTANDFSTCWLKHYSDDPILKQFMSMRWVADVLHIRGRELLDRT